MQVGKIINRIVVPPLAKVGFHKIPSGKSSEWIFAQSKEEFQHMIQIRAETIRFPSGQECKLAVSFHSTAPNSGFGVRLANILESIPPELKDDVRFFVTDQQVEEFLAITTEATIESVIPIFDCLDRPIIVPSKQLYEELSINTEQRAISFMEHNSLCFANDVSGLKKMILKTEEIIKAEQFSPLEEISELLLDATAYVGELVRKLHAGQWSWDPNYGRVYLLTNVGGYKSCMSGALGITFSYWARPEIYSGSIRSDYKELLHRMNIESYYE
ncbi:MAG: hypothetical protein FWH57_04605 [Oscillospiraceae bacterium]|nr:hypothetical protein [Oscillospiraceae bacterium]